MAKACDTYYGTGRPWPNGSSSCSRPEGHPPVNVDRIGHSDSHVAGDEPTESE